MRPFDWPWIQTRVRKDVETCADIPYTFMRPFRVAWYERPESPDPKLRVICLIDHADFLQFRINRETESSLRLLGLSTACMSKERVA
jgi:hypothetical protein